MNDPIIIEGKVLQPVFSKKEAVIYLAQVTHPDKKLVLTGKGTTEEEALKKLYAKVARWKRQQKKSAQPLWMAQGEDPKERLAIWNRSAR